MNKILIIFIFSFVLSEGSFGLQALLKAGSEELSSKRFYATSRHSPVKRRFFSNTPSDTPFNVNGQIPVSEEVRKEIQASSRSSMYTSVPGSLSEKEKFVDDVAKYDRKVLHNEAAEEKDWSKSLQGGWRDFTKAAEENHELSAEKFFDDRIKSDQAAKKEDRLEMIRDLAEKMVTRGIDLKDISEITGLSEENILKLKTPKIKEEIHGAHYSLSEKEKFVDDMAKYDRKVLHNEAAQEKDWTKNLQEGWRDFTNAAKENHELSSEKFFDERMKSDQAAKKEDRLEVIRDLAEKMVTRGIGPKDISEITGLSETDILSLKNLKSSKE